MKTALRAQVVAARRALGPDALRARSEALAGHPLPDALAHARTVGAYLALPSEPDPSFLAARLAASGARLVHPVVPAAGRVLGFALHVGRVAPGLRHTPEPDGPAVPLDELDALLVPGLAFDRRGGRLGRGGGYFDATLAAAHRALRVGICLDEELVDEVPREAHDEAVDLVITPSRVWTTMARAK